jgi:hypothetical protein
MMRGSCIHHPFTFTVSSVEAFFYAVGKKSYFV